LEKVLDVDRFIRMLAMEVVLCHWDGYMMNRNNYRIITTWIQDRLLFLPHGMDQTFGVKRASPDMSITPEIRGSLARSVLDVPEVWPRYLGAIADLTTNLFDVQR